jgi:hypothetical protein
MSLEVPNHQNLCSHHMKELHTFSCTQQPMDAKSAQMKVRAFSSRIYTSHRRASERVGQELDKIQG